MYIIDQLLDLQKFPSPYWGLFFYHERAERMLNGSKFPSPYWGLIFYLVKGTLHLTNCGISVSVPVLGINFLSPFFLANLMKCKLLSCFRPHTGD